MTIMMLKTQEALKWHPKMPRYQSRSGQASGYPAYLSVSAVSAVLRASIDTRDVQFFARYRAAHRLQASRSWELHICATGCF